MTKARVRETREYQRIVARAVKEATRLNRGSVGQEHLLLALIADEKSRAGKALAEQMPLQIVRFATEFIYGRGTYDGQAGIFPVTEKVLLDAHKEARSMAMDRVNPVLLLIALTNDKDGAATQVFTTLRVDIAALRRYLFQHLT